MRAFRTSTITTELDEETGEEYEKTKPILVIQFNNLEKAGGYLMQHEQQADCLATLITQFGNRPDELLNMGQILCRAAMNSNGEMERR